MPQRAQGRDEAGTSYGHHLVDGEWVELVSDGQGRIVRADGDWSDPDNWVEPETLTDFGRYAFTKIVDGEVVHAYEETALSGGPEGGHTAVRLIYRDDDGAPSDLRGEVTETPVYSHTVITDEGMIEHRYGQGYQTLDEHGAVVMSEGAETDYDIRFESFAEYEGRRAVVGVDGDGEQVLLTPAGYPIEADVDWSSVRLIETPVLEGDPIAIGDYALDPRGGVVERVYLFEDGSQAIKGDDGEFQRVIVPTDVEYPEGRPVFQGRFYAGEDRSTIDRSDSEFATVFAFRDGQTATWVDGELMLVDMPIEVDYPTGAPVACGAFPGGDLFVFEDGTQLLRTPNGQWGIGTFPDLPPFEELVERYGEPDLDALYEEGVPTLVPNDDLVGDLLVDDITGSALLPDDSAVDQDDPLDESTPDTTAETGVETVEAPGGVEATEQVLTDPFESDPTDLTSTSDDGGLGDGLVEEFAEADPGDELLLDDG